MIAIPLDTKEATIISQKYGNAEYFAILDEKVGTHIVIKNNECGNGIKTAKFVKDTGVDSTIFYFMGKGVYDVFAQNSISVYTTEQTHFTIEEIARLVNTNSLKKLDAQNCNELLNSGTNHCTCGCEHNK